ncbi:MAG TPA: hypothetical protein VF741_04070, partial [Candidatus Aquilonibacter sp.]
LSHNDQDVTFEDVAQDSSGNTAITKTVHPQDPVVNADPAISQEALGQYANNPVMRFYVGVQQNELATYQVEAQLTRAVLQLENECEQQ